MDNQDLEGRVIIGIKSHTIKSNSTNFLIYLNLIYKSNLAKSNIMCLLSSTTGGIENTNGHTQTGQ